jgi:hypothetical protein
MHYYLDYDMNILQVNFETERVSQSFRVPDWAIVEVGDSKSDVKLATGLRPSLFDPDAETKRLVAIAEETRTKELGASFEDRMKRTKYAKQREDRLKKRELEYGGDDNV